MSENKALTTVKTFQVNGVDVSLSPAMAINYLVKGSNLTEKEAVMFVNLCFYNRLNPYTGDAYLVKYGGDAQMIVSKQAALKLADRNPNRDGFEAGLIVKDSNGNITDRDGSFYLENDEVLGGWCKVYRKDFRVPVTARVMLSEYSKNQATWKTMKATMIRKVAIHQAHREAFPEEYQGVYIAEEFGHTDVELRKVEGETIRENKREKTVDVELPSGQIIKTYGITGFILNAIQELTDGDAQASKDLNYYLKGKDAETVLELTEEEGEELKQILMDKYADKELEIESDDIDGLDDLVEKTDDKSDNLFEEGE